MHIKLSNTWAGVRGFGKQPACPPRVQGPMAPCERWGGDRGLPLSPDVCQLLRGSYGRCGEGEGGITGVGLIAVGRMLGSLWEAAVLRAIPRDALAIL